MKTEHENPDEPPPWGEEREPRLTKADKGGPKAIKKVTAAVRKAIAEVGCPEPVAIVQTSSRSKGGRADMWRLMRGVVTEHREE